MLMGKQLRGDNVCSAVKNSGYVSRQTGLFDCSYGVF